MERITANRSRLTFAIIALSAAISVATGGLAYAVPFDSGERIAFFGDSITHGGKYIYYLQLWENLRNPGSGVRLLNCGISGDTAGDALGRLSVDLLPMKPDRVVAMFGMNDVGRSSYATAEPTEAQAKARAKSLERYAANMDKVAECLAAANLRTVLMTPTPYDQYTKSGGENLAQCNEPGLTACAEIVRKLAERRSLEIVELHRPMTDMFRNNLDFRFCGDRIHPGKEGHLVMAAHVLKAFGASPLVARVEVDVLGKADGPHLNAAVSDVAKTVDGVSFTYEPHSLPFPALPEYTTVEKKGFFNLAEALNREEIAVSGLADGTYALLFDGKDVAHFTSAELKRGVNVATLDTENQRRAQAAARPLGDIASVQNLLRDYAHLANWVRDAGIGDDDHEKADAHLDKWLKSKESSPYHGAFKLWVKNYRDVRGRKVELEAKLNRLLAEMSAARPAAEKVEVRRTDTIRRAADGKAWRDAQPRNIQIVKGSALDLSDIGHGGEAGRFGRAVIGSSGHLVFADMPKKHVRLYGYVMDWSNVKWLVRDGAGGDRSDRNELIDRYAEQVRRHGYNFVRPHGMFDKMGRDDWSETGAFTPQRLDDLDYLCAALKKRGVYLYLDMAAYGMRFGEKVPPNMEMKSKVMEGDPEYVAAWKKCAKEILERVNPYTGLAYKDDPAVVCIMQYNEQATGAKIVRRKNDGKLTKESHLELTERFFETARMYNEWTAVLGYRGLNSNYNSDVDLGATAARWMHSDIVSYNYHFGHPIYGGGRDRVGDRVDQNDSCSMSARGYDFACGARLRFPDRPYICSEYSQAYWNRRRYESGVLLPSYASLNGFDGILWHANGVELENSGRWPRGRIEIFNIFSSPVARAAAFVASHIYLRGDVAEARHQTIVEYPESVWRENTMHAPNTIQAKIGYLMKTGVSFRGLSRPAAVKGPEKGDVTLAPSKCDGVEDGYWVSRVVAGTDRTFDLDAFVADMKKKRLLPKSNCTDDKKGIYESETGEILMDGKEQWLTVVTPRTEAAALVDGRVFSLDRMKVRSSERALAALVSRDGKPLDKSRRMVFVYATQEANTGFETKDREREIVAWGGGPALLKTGRIEVRVHTGLKDRFRLYMLDYSGERLEEIPVSRTKGGALSFVIDTSATVHGPTPFFELVAEARIYHESVVWDDRPASADEMGIENGDEISGGYRSGPWGRSWYPIGNGRLGCMVDGDPRKMRIQFNVDSLWTGGENISRAVSDADAWNNLQAMGAYQNFGELDIPLEGLPDGDVAGYRRELDISSAIYSDRFTIGGAEVRRRVFASAPDDAIFIVIDAADGVCAKPSLRGVHGETTVRDAGTLSGALFTSQNFSSRLPNNLEYAACVNVFQLGRQTVIVLRAKTGVARLTSPTTVPRPSDVLSRHVADYRGYYDRMAFNLGEGDSSVPTRVRLDRVRSGADDPALISLMFNFGRYLLISCSRRGTLPANLQGLWNDSNNPAWHSDYHTNINLQMNYWGADAANLSDCFETLSDWLFRIVPVAEKETRAAFPGSRGYAFRTSLNAVGGGGWRWNFAGAPWLAAQCYDHWRFTRDDTYLRNVCWPLMKGAAEFMISTQLKERSDGTVIVKGGWSPEHGPREDGITHDQQIVRELFRSIIAAAKVLEIDDSFVQEVARLEPRLLKDKIGRWGQLQEWETDRDVQGDTHRHTSHLFAVYPGTTISRKETPELAKAARTSLLGRALTGDARRSWTWPWRAALWARLGDGDRAGDMLRSLLRYNTYDNLLVSHPPFQIDGNLGMVAAVCEMLLENAIPSAWPHGSAEGLRTRDGTVKNVSW